MREDHPWDLGRDRLAVLGDRRLDVDGDPTTVRDESERRRAQGDAAPLSHQPHQIGLDGRRQQHRDDEHYQEYDDDGADR